MGLVTERVSIKYSLIFESAFHFGTGLRAGLVHRTIARDKDGYLYVPGSTLKGVLRDRCEQLARLFELTVAEPHETDNSEVRIREARLKDPDIILRIFGSRYLPGAVYFDNAAMVEASTTAIDRTYFDGHSEQGPEKGKYKARQVEQRTQVSLSRYTRTAKSGHLYTSEYGIRQLGFEGQLYGYLTGFPLTELGRGTYSLLLLLAGLLSLDKIGGNKSTGAGRVQVAILDDGLSIEGQVIKPDTILEQLSALEYYDLEREDTL